MGCGKLYSIGCYFLHREAINCCMQETQTQSKKYRQLDKALGAYFRTDDLYSQLYQKHFISFQNVETIGKDALAVPYDDCESGDYTISLTQNNIVFEFNCDAIVEVTDNLVYLKQEAIATLSIKPKVVHGMSKVYHK